LPLRGKHRETTLPSHFITSLPHLILPFFHQYFRQKIKRLGQSFPIATGALFAFILLHPQRSPMGNRPHKKEKASKRSKELFVELAAKAVNYAVAITIAHC
jgi:hypothetical protein